LLRFGRDQRFGKRRFVELLVVGQGRGRFDGVDANNGAAKPLLVGSELLRQVGKGRFVAELAAELLARGLQLAALTADAARPGILTQRVDHRSADSALREGLEFDTPGLVKAMSRVDQANDAILDEVTDIDRVRHGRRNTAGKLFNEGYARDDSRMITDGLLLGAAHLEPPGSS